MGCLEETAVDVGRTMGEELSEDNEGRVSVVVIRVADTLLDRCMPDAMNVEMLM